MVQASNDAPVAPTHPPISAEGKKLIEQLGRKLMTTTEKLAQTDPVYAGIVGELYALLDDLFSGD